MLSDIAKKLLLGRGCGDDIVSVRDYECGDSCGRGPRIILSVPGKIDVCYNIEQLRDKLDKYPNVRGRDLAEFLV